MIQYIFTTLFLCQISLASDLPLEKIKLPKGFSISVYAKDIPNARAMTWGANGTLFVGSRGAGNIYAVKPNGEITTLVENLNMPSGVAFKDGNLYVAEVHRILKFNNIENQIESIKTKKLKYDVIAEYPKDSHHGWKFTAFGPDGKLYVPQGAPCNVCEVKDLYGTISRLDENGKNLEIIAKGVRNSVGFDWHPVTKEMWWTDNGRDMLGDDVPNDELNRISKEGQHFGFPYCHAGEVLDPEFGKNKKCSDYEKPAQKLGPHVAAIGMRFYTGKSFPQKYQQQIFIAEHGSWNRSVPIGYRITSVQLDKDNKTSKNYEVFAEGWLQNGKPWGRPADVINTPDGGLLVSDDFANVIYKIEYRK